MFPGEEKEAVLSPQMKLGVDFETYKADQARLVNDLRGMLLRYGLDTQFRVDPTRIHQMLKINVLGKLWDLNRFYPGCKEHDLQPQYFIAFGDSKSDVGMAEEIYRHGFPVELVFVGEKEQLKEMHLPFLVSFTQASCEKGTVEYLKNRPQHIQNL